MLGGAEGREVVLRAGRWCCGQGGSVGFVPCPDDARSQSLGTSIDIRISRFRCCFSRKPLFNSFKLASRSPFQSLLSFTMNSQAHASTTKGSTKTLRIFLFLLVVLYYILSILYVVVSRTFVAGIGIIPMTISGLLSLSELGILDRILPKKQQEYNIVLGDHISPKSGYKLRPTYRLLVDLALIISLLLILIFMIVEMAVRPSYYFNAAAAFLGSYCTMPLLLGMLVCSFSLVS
jgi:hypothetical protein